MPVRQRHSVGGRQWHCPRVAVFLPRRGIFSPGWTLVAQETAPLAWPQPLPRPIGNAPQLGRELGGIATRKASTDTTHNKTRAEPQSATTMMTTAMMIRVLGFATIFTSAAAAECGADVLTPAQAAVAAGSTTAEACTAPAAETPANGACATQTYAAPETAVWTSTNTWTDPSVAAVWTSTNTWNAGDQTCSDGSHTTEAACIAPGTCNDAGGTSPADATACAALLSVAASCIPPLCVLTDSTDCSTDSEGNDTGCIYTAPLPASDIEAVAGSCSDLAATYNAPAEATCSDSSLTTEADCIAVGTWTAAVTESCTECSDAEETPRASGASTVAVTVIIMSAAVAQTL